MKKIHKVLSLLLSLMLITGLLAACGNGDTTAPGGPGDDTTTNGETDPADSNGEDLDAVNLVYYLWGGDGNANNDILAEINAKMTEDINATLEIRLIDWPDIATRYPLLFASGEQFDMAHASPGAAISYFTLAAQDVIVDITDMLPDYAPDLMAEIPESTWDGARYNGRIYGVPTVYSEFTPYGYVYRRDLIESYGLDEINSIESMEAYMDAVLENETFAPINGDSVDAQNLYRMFVSLTGSWMEAPGIPLDQLHLVAASADNYNEIFHPAFTDEFVEFAELMHEWSSKRYWPTDILSAQEGAKNNFNNGLSGGFITHMPDWTGNYGAVRETLPDVDTDFWTFAEDNDKIVRKMGVENSTVISYTSDNPERALMAIELLMTNEEYYRLIQYGIEGRQYEVVDGVARQPENFDAESDGGGFAVWSLRNDRFNIPYATEDPRRYELNEEWDQVAINNPFVGFAFDSEPVSNELSSIASVNSQIGIQIMLGKTQDPIAGVEQYREQLERAGIETVIAEVISQLEDHTPPDQT